MYFWNLILYIFVHFYIPFFVHSYFIINKKRNSQKIERIKCGYKYNNTIYRFNKRRNRKVVTNLRENNSIKDGNFKNYHLSF